MYFLGIHNRLKVSSCVYREKKSESWDISRYTTRNRCITSINAPNRLGKHAFVTVGLLHTFTFNICFLNNTTLRGVLKFLKAYSNKLCLSSSLIHNYVNVLIFSTSNVSSILMQGKH